MSYSGQISIKNIIQDYINKSGHKGNLNEEYVYIAAEEALDQIITGNGYFEYIILLNLYNQKAELPPNCKNGFIAALILFRFNHDSFSTALFNIPLASSDVKPVSVFIYL